MLLETDVRIVWDEILPGILSIYEKSPWNDAIVDTGADHAQAT